MIFLDPPEDFHPSSRIVGCFLEHNGKFLVLLRHPSKVEGGKWGIPAGKQEGDETEMEALVREMKEETGILLSPNRVGNEYLVYVRYPNEDFSFRMFASLLDEKPEIVLSPEEHTDYRWVAPEEALKMSLVLDGDECIRRFYYLDDEGDFEDGFSDEDDE